MSNSRFAHYEVLEKIGQGGMGEVYRATDSRLGRDVALKMLPEALARNEERLARFQREAQVLAALNHPGIASVYGLETQDGQTALAMELVSGPDLSDRLKSGPVPVAEGLGIALQLAEAIEAAHEKGIVHRDLKPANIKLTDEGRVKVLDFGLAKALAEDLAADDTDLGNSPTLTAHMTMGNVILGTAAYMSPEQARGTEVDRRADIWAYGVVVAEMLGGRRLFEGETTSDTLAAVLKSEIELDTLPADLPPAVVRMLRRCLRRDPRQRLRDIGDARLVLQDVLDGGTAEVAEATPAAGNPWALRGALVVAALAIAGALYGFLRPAVENELPLRKFEITMDRSDPSATTTFSPKISPDGRYVLYTSQDQIWVRDLRTTIARVLPGTKGARDPFWSPDSEWICFGTSTAMMKIDRGGGNPMALANMAGNQSMGSASSGTWNPDGRILYTTGNTGVLTVPAQAGEIKMFHPPQEGEVDFHQICRLPDDHGWIIVVHSATDYGQLSLLTADGERKQVLSYPDDAFASPVWSPTGHLIFWRNEVAMGIWAIPFSLDELQVSGEPFLVAAGGRRPSVSEDGTLVYSTGVTRYKQQLAWYDRQGKELEALSQVTTTRPFPELSPDEKKILLAVNDGPARDIWLFDTTNGNEQRLTFDGPRWTTAAWLPDGLRFITYTESNYTSSLFHLDGSQPVRDLGPGILSSVSPDGEEWLYGRPRFDDGFDFDVYARPLDGEIAEERELIATPAVDWAPLLSPDGKYLLYTSDETGRDEIYATTYPGLTGRWLVSRDGGSFARWRGDSREVLYTTHDEMYSVSVSHENGLTLGRPVKLFDRPNTGWSAAWPDGFDVTADGERFIMLKPVVSDSIEQPAIVVVQNWFSEFAED